MNHLFEYVAFGRRINPNLKEPKKPKKGYSSKKIDISKVELGRICDLIGFPVHKVKFLSSGAFGNAYRIDDYVLKITTDKVEAESVYNLIGSKVRKSIVWYYGINMYKLKGKYVYIILMDYVTPFKEYFRDKFKFYDKEQIENFLEIVFNVFYENWRELKSKKEFTEKILDKFDADSRIAFYMIDKFWSLYLNLRFLEKCPDLHSGNLGVKNGKFVLFDFRDYKIIINKFNEPEILK